MKHLVFHGVSEVFEQLLAGHVCRKSIRTCEPVAVNLNRIPGFVNVMVSPTHTPDTMSRSKNGAFLHICRFCQVLTEMSVRGPGLGFLSRNLELRARVPKIRVVPRSVLRRPDPSRPNRLVPTEANPNSNSRLNLSRTNYTEKDQSSKIAFYRNTRF